MTTPARTLAGALALGSIAACSVVSGIDDFEFRPKPVTATSEGGNGGLGAGGGAALPCEVPVAGLNVDHDMRLCEGTFLLDVAPGDAAIDIVADGVTLECAGTVVDGSDPTKGSATDPTIGIRVGALEGVTVRGCGARGYRHGFAATGAGNLHLDDVHFDDNFTDPAANWLADTRGGGILLDAVTGGLVEGSSFARNWNGIELRSTSGVVVRGCVGDHASNTGALLLASHDNEISHNDLSWAVRGNPSFPDDWYGIDTKDSAALLLDAGSRDNRILDNDLRYGGDGIFIRGLTGPCAEDNLVARNDVSYSPHNGIECTCDGNVLDDNVSVASNFGIWAGGAERTLIRRNTIQDSKHDGISIQIWENRHNVIEDNVVTGSGRVGLLVTGRTLHEWQDLETFTSPELANSSHVLVQRNTLDMNTDYDVFASSTRSLLMLSNCGPGGDLPMTNLPKGQTSYAAKEVEPYAIRGNCTGAGGKQPPTAAIATPASIALGETAVLDASASQPADGGAALTYTWLVQPGWPRYVPASTLPALLWGGEGPATIEITPSEPGLYDVDVTVDDGTLGAIATHPLAVLPAGLRVGQDASAWDAKCGGCSATFSDEPGGLEGTEVHLVTDATESFAAFAPKAKDLALPIGSFSRVVLFVRAKNPNELGWQGSWPAIVLASTTGRITLTPKTGLLPVQPGAWVYVDAPVAGDASWTRAELGTLDSVDWIELVADTWGYGGFELWIDALSVY